MLLFFESSLLLGWDGYDHGEVEAIEIQKGNLVRKYKDSDRPDQTKNLVIDQLNKVYKECCEKTK